MIIQFFGLWFNSELTEVESDPGLAVTNSKVGLKLCHPVSKFGVVALFYRLTRLGCATNLRFVREA